MKLTTAFIYGVLLLISFLICASVWHWQMTDVYFVCHKALLADFLPPFIRPGEGGNFYIRPVRIIYAIWLVYLAVMFLAPAAGTWLLLRLRQRALSTNSWQ